MKWIKIQTPNAVFCGANNAWRKIEQRLTAISGVQNRPSVAYSIQPPLGVQNKHLTIETQKPTNYTTTNGDKAIGWLKKLAGSLNQQMENVDKSIYIVFKVNGVQKVLRIANHRGAAREFADRGEFKGNFGIVIKMNEKKFQTDNRVEYKEQVFFPDKLDDSKLDQIIAGAKHFIQTGEYNGPNGDQINISPKSTTSKQTKENTMKKLNITKEHYNKSKYFQNKYGKLEYVSESGNIYKTNFGRILRFANESVDDEVIRANIDSITQHGIITSELKLNKNQLKEWMSSIGAIEPYEDIMDDVLLGTNTIIHLAQPISTVILSMAKSSR